jgi:SAM-dependent methyltransferase
VERADGYGESFADVYDDWYAEVTDAEATARFVAARCGSCPVLELGVGTGRLARPLQAAGCTVFGVDASAAMLAGCTDPTSGEVIRVVQADLAWPPFRAGFGAVLLAFNTLFNLPTASRQRTLFEAVAPLLTADGVLVVEVTNADVLADGPARSMAVSRRYDDGLTVVATSLDPDQQRLDGQHLDIRAGGLRSRPWTLRWSTVDEIDRMAAAAGMELSERYDDWDGGEFSAASATAISVFRRTELVPRQRQGPSSREG